MNKDEKDYLCIYVIFITIVVILLVFACIINKTEIDKLKKNIITLTSKENTK